MKGTEQKMERKNAAKINSDTQSGANYNTILYNAIRAIPFPSFRVDYSASERGFGPPPPPSDARRRSYFVRERTRDVSRYFSVPPEGTC